MLMLTKTTIWATNQTSRYSDLPADLERGMIRWFLQSISQSNQFDKWETNYYNCKVWFEKHSSQH